MRKLGLSVAAIGLLATACSSGDPGDPAPATSPAASEETSVEPTPTATPNVNPTVNHSVGLEERPRVDSLPQLIQQSYRGMREVVLEIEKDFQDDRRRSTEKKADVTVELRGDSRKLGLVAQYEYVPANSKKNQAHSYRLQVWHPDHEESRVTYERGKDYTIYSKTRRELVNPQLDKVFDVVMGAMLESAYDSAGNQLPKWTKKGPILELVTGLGRKPISLKIPSGIEIIECGGSLSSYHCVLEESFSKQKIEAVGNASQQNRNYYGIIPLDITP